MSSIYEDLGTDPGLESAGQWYNYKGETRILVRHAGGANKKFKMLYRRLTKPYTNAIRTETMDEDLGEDLMREAVAKGLVADWETFVTEKDEAGAAKLDDAGKAIGKWIKGIPQPDGSTAPVTPDNIMKVFQKLPRLAKLIMEFSTEHTNYQKATREEDAKNS